jgi:ATP-dependent helicase YprA (DUF1998 family)
LNFGTLNNAFDYTQSPIPSNFSLSAAQQLPLPPEGDESPHPSHQCPPPSELSPASFLLTETNHDVSDEVLSGGATPPKLQLSCYIKSPDLLESYQDQGVTELFEWQAACLEQYHAGTQRNLIYSAPTSAGKTLVAEVLLAR